MVQRSCTCRSRIIIFLSVRFVISKWFRNKSVTPFDVIPRLCWIFVYKQNRKMILNGKFSKMVANADSFIKNELFSGPRRRVSRCSLSRHFYIELPLIIKRIWWHLNLRTISVMYAGGFHLFISTAGPLMSPNRAASTLQERRPCWWNFAGLLRMQ